MDILSKLNITKSADFNKTEAQNMIIHNLASAPSNPVEGLAYYNTTNHKFYIWNSSKWISLEEYISNIVGSAAINVAIVSGVATISIIQSGIDHTQISGRGTNTHAQIDSHIGDATIHFTQSSIDHANIQNRGVNTHAVIDTHLANTSIHTVINDSGTSSTETWSAAKIKSYIDAMRSGQDWQDSVISTLNTPPSNPSAGARYRIGTAPTGVWASYANYIAQWNGSSWGYSLSEGFAVWDETTDAAYLWNGSSWTNFSTSSHNSLGGLNVGDYQHLTMAQFTALTGSIDASAYHNHDSRYSLTNHNHDGSYTKSFSSLNTSTGGVETFTHNLGKQFCIIQVYSVSTNQLVLVDTECTSTTQAKVYFPSGISAGQYRICIAGVV